MEIKKTNKQKTFERRKSFAALFTRGTESKRLDDLICLREPLSSAFTGPIVFNPGEILRGRSSWKNNRSSVVGNLKAILKRGPHKIKKKEFQRWAGL